MCFWQSVEKLLDDAITTTSQDLEKRQVFTKQKAMLHRLTQISNRYFLNIAVDIVLFLWKENRERKGETIMIYICIFLFANYSCTNLKYQTNDFLLLQPERIIRKKETSPHLHIAFLFYFSQIGPIRGSLKVWWKRRERDTEWVWRRRRRRWSCWSFSSWGESSELLGVTLWRISSPGCLQASMFLNICAWCRNPRMPKIIVNLL